MTYTDFPIDAALAWVEAEAPDLIPELKPAEFDQMEAFEELFEDAPPDQVVDFLEAMGAGSTLPFTRKWHIDIEDILTAYTGRPWLGEEDVSMMLVQLGFKTDARQYDLFLQGPFHGGRAGSLVVMETLSKELARDGIARPLWTVAGSLAEFICLPVFVERCVSAGPDAPTRWMARDGEYALLDNARKALEARGFVAEPFSSNKAAALRRGKDAVALMEQQYPLEAIACGPDSTLNDVATALAEAGAFDKV